MQVFVNGDPISDAVPANGTLENALGHVQSHLCDPAQVVVGIRCDGRDIPGEEMASTLQKPVGSFSRLDVFTSTRAALVAGAMKQAAASLEETETVCQRIAEHLIEGRTTEAIGTLSECLKVWQQVHEAIGQSIHMLELDAERITIHDEPMVTVIGKPKEILLQIKRALQARDHVLLADVLQYELKDVTDTWYALIDRLRQEAEEVP